MDILKNLLIVICCTAFSKSTLTILSFIALAEPTNKAVRLRTAQVLREEKLLLFSFIRNILLNHLSVVGFCCTLRAYNLLDAHIHFLRYVGKLIVF